MDANRVLDEAGGGPRLFSRYPSSQAPHEKEALQQWVQCTYCKKWRKVPYHLKDSDLGDSWECSENIWDPMYASCNVAQALSDEQIDAILESRQEIEEQGETQAAPSEPPDDYPAHDDPVQPKPQHRSKGREERKRAHDGTELSDVAEAMLKLQEDAANSLADNAYSKSVPCSLVPARLIWGKVEGHDWWPAKVVRRRSVPSEVGPPPGGAAEVMYYTPVVFFTPKGIPKEVELSMDSEEFPITICQRACGLLEEDEAEYAWLSADNIRPFSHGDTSGKKDGSLVSDEHLQRCILAAKNDLASSESQTKNWKDDEDSDGGWCCAAEFHRNRNQKQRKANRRAKKRPGEEEGGSDIESGPDEGPELIPYGSFRLAPKISVEHIYAWRWPLTRAEKAKELEKENEENAMNLKKLAFLRESLLKQRLISASLFDDFEIEGRKSELIPAHSRSVLDESDLMQQEREAVSTLLGLGPLSEIDGEPVLASMDEAEYFVKYANRSHLHNEWVKESTLMTFAKRKLTQFKRRYSDEPIDMFNKKWAKAERIISRRKCRTGPGWELLIKWMDLGYEYCTWESENARILSRPESVLLYIDLWRRQLNAVKKKSKKAMNLFHETKTQIYGSYKPLEGKPPWLSSSRLHEHQLEALNWFRSTWLQDKGGVLLGDPGQGRTAAAAAFLQCLKEELKCVHPFLLVVPANQMAKWSGEIDFWSGGQINCVQFQGAASARSICLEHEIWQHMECMDGRFPCRETRKILKPDVVLVSADSFPVEMDNLLEVLWDLAILDCRWVAKGALGRLANGLAQTQCPHFILASELPSSESGLMSTLRLIDANQASRLEPHSSHEDQERDERMIEHLQSLIKKRIFEVCTPARPFPHQVYKEVLIPLDFKPDQKEQYKESLVKYYDFLKDEGLHRFSVQNVGTLKHISEELSLICQHPILADDNEEFDHVGAAQLIEQSGKFTALEVLLRALLESNINTLVLTQSQKTLTLLMRLVMDRFGHSTVECISAGDSTAKQHNILRRFISSHAHFLLTTGECCGLGMTLSKVSCVVIVESALRSDDDLLALSYAYQIGQTNELAVMRLFLAGTVEERMLNVITKSDSVLISPLSKGSSRTALFEGSTLMMGAVDDMKVFEDVLIWGTHALFDKNPDLQRHPFLQSSLLKSTPCQLDGATCKALLRAISTSRTEGVEGDFGPELYSIKWKEKTKQSICQSHEVAELVEVVIHMHDALLIAGYWEQLLRHEWTEHRRREDANHRVKRLTAHRTRCDLIDYEMEKEGSDHDDPANKDLHLKRKPVHRRKRFTRENEAFGASKGQKKQKSHKLDSEMPPVPEEDRNDENKWSREALLGAKAHQDVLTQILSDHNTAEGKTAQDAFARIDLICTELSLPMNIILMAKQVAQILLTMKEDQDGGSYFHDYTLLTIIAFAAYLGGISLGEGCGLKALATKYHQDLETMEKLFNYIAKLMLEYKQMLIKINQLTHSKGKLEEEKRPESSTPAVDHAHSLHRDLDQFLRSVSEILKKAKEREKEIDIKKLATEILDEPPGTPIKGHTPSQWFPQAVASESASLAKQARVCDAEMYLIEKLHDSTIRSIEKTFQSFQERVREHGVKAIETVSYETMLSRSQVEERKLQLRQDLHSRTQQKAEPVSSNAYGVLLAKFQQTKQWQSKPDAQPPMPSPVSQPPVRNVGFLDRSMQQGSSRDEAAPSHFPVSQPSIEFLQRASYGAAAPRPPALPVDPYLLTVSPTSNTALTGFQKAPELSSTAERRGLMAKSAHGVPRVMQYTVPSHPFSINKASRNTFHNVKLPVGFPRQSVEEPSALQHPLSLQTINLGPNQHPAFVSGVFSLQQAPAQSIPIQLQSSPAMLPSVFPNSPALYMWQHRIPHPTVPSMHPPEPQRSEAENPNPVQSQMTPAHTLTWSSAPRVPALGDEGASYMQPRPKMQPATSLSLSEWLPKTSERSAPGLSAAAMEPAEEPRSAPRLERSTSIPTGKATITTGIGKAASPQLTRQSSQPEYLMRSAVVSPSNQSSNDAAAAPLEAIPRPQVPAAVTIKDPGSLLAERMIQTLPQQMLSHHQLLQSPQALPIQRMEVPPPPPPPVSELPSLVPIPPSNPGPSQRDSVHPANLAAAKASTDMWEMMSPVASKGETQWLAVPPGLESRSFTMTHENFNLADSAQRDIPDDTIPPPPPPE